MVIFGAGASYNSSLRPVDRPDGCPPLAQELFDDRPVFNRAISKYPECRPLVSHLRDQAALPDPPVLEDVLARTLAQAGQNAETLRQLLALRFYLREAIAEHTSAWMDDIAGLTNYGRLLRRVGDWRAETNEQVVLVTFNYDVMLDTALTEQLALGDTFGQPSDYVRRDAWKLCTLHGSTNWMRKIRMPNPMVGVENAAHAISIAHELDLTSGTIVRGQLPDKGPQSHTAAKDEADVYVPALAVPTTGKSTFETHPSHLEAFDAAVPQVDRLLIVGWRGIEAHVLDRIKTIRPHYSLGIVDPEAEAVCSRLEGAVIDDLGNRRTASVGNRAVRRVTWPGFSQLVSGDDVDSWLRVELPTDSYRNTELVPWSDRTW
jgi:hypothetical protein